MLGYGGLMTDGLWPQLHADSLALLPSQQCSGLQLVFSRSSEGLAQHACTGKEQCRWVQGWGGGGMCLRCAFMLFRILAMSWRAPYGTLQAPPPPPAGASPTFRSCATGNVGAPLLIPSPPTANSSAPLLLGLLASGFSCSTTTAVTSASSPALFTWLPPFSSWITQQVAAAAARG